MSTEIVVDHYQSPAAPVIEDRTMRYLEAQAKQLARSGLVPSSLRGKPDDVLAVLAWGHVIGLTPAVAVQEVHNIQGRPFPSARAVVAAANVRGHRVRVIESTRERCTVMALRAGDPDSWAVTVTYTLEDAKVAGLLGKDVWKQSPADMLFARASRRAVKMIAPEVLLGMAELGFVVDDDPATTYTVTAQVDQPAAIEAAVQEPRWHDLWRERCLAAGCDRATSAALIDAATQGRARTSVDVTVADRPDCDLLLAKWAEARPADVAAWLEEPEAE